MEGAWHRPGGVLAWQWGCTWLCGSDFVLHERFGAVCSDTCASRDYVSSGGLARALHSDPGPKEHLEN